MAELLKDWVNPHYLSTTTIKQVEQAYQAAAVPSVQLGDFLLPEKAAAVRKALENVKITHQYIPHMHSFSTSDAQLPAFYSFLASSGFKTLLGTMIRKEIKTLRPRIFIYAHKDYTLLHDTIEHHPGVLLFFDFTKGWNEDAGGKTVVVSPTADPILFSRTFNALSLVALQPDVHYFLKYVNALVGKNRIYLVVVECE